MVIRPRERDGDTATGSGAGEVREEVGTVERGRAEVGMGHEGRGRVAVDAGVEWSAAGTGPDVSEVRGTYRYVLDTGRAGNLVQCASVGRQDDNRSKCDPPRLISCHANLQFPGHLASWAAHPEYLTHPMTGELHHTIHCVRRHDRGQSSRPRFLVGGSEIGQ